MKTTERDGIRRAAFEAFEASRRAALTYNRTTSDGALARTLGISRHRVRYLRGQWERNHNLERAAVIYFIRAGRFVKIGWTLDPAGRLKTIQANCPVIARLLAVVPGGLKEERALHKAFASCRVHGEWFRLTPELLNYIRRVRKTGALVPVEDKSDG